MKPNDHHIITHSVDDLRVLAKQKVQLLYDHLNTLEHTRKNSLWRKLIGRTCDHIRTIERLLSPEDPSRNDGFLPRQFEAGALTMLEESLNRIPALEPDRVGVSALWEIKNQLRQCVPQLADDLTLHIRLQAELNSDVEGAHGKHWSDLFDKTQLSSLIDDGYDRERGEFRSVSQRRDAQSRLLALYMEQDDSGRYERTQSEQRGTYLIRISGVMLGVIIVIAAILIGIGLEPEFVNGETGEKDWLKGIATLGIVLLSGALGSMLALLYKFRDSIQRITNMRAHGSIWITQTVIGATLALVLLIIYRAGFIQIAKWDNDSLEPVVLALFSFIAGYSEPFVLQIMNRIERLVE